jgi:hypothetical protein
MNGGLSPGLRVSDSGREKGDIGGWQVLRGAAVAGKPGPLMDRFS